MRTTFIQVLTEAARLNDDIVLMTGDLGFKIFDELREVMGPRFINAGVAEANMVSVAAGMAMAGKTVYCYTMVPFLIMRAFEQIRVDICSHNLPVRLVGIGAALGYPMEGTTHHAIEDLAIMRALPNMTVVAPGDKREAQALVRRSLDFNGPLYIRLARDSNDVVHSSVPKIRFGESIVLNEGTDITLISSGPVLSMCTDVQRRLSDKGFSVALVSMPSVKPIDLVTLKKIANNSSSIFTIEEHSIVAGFGSAIAEELIEMGYTGVFKRIGLPDAYFSVVGDTDYLRKSVGLDSESIETTICDTFERVNSPTVKKSNCRDN